MLDNYRRRRSAAPLSLHLRQKVPLPSIRTHPDLLKFSPKVLLWPPDCCTAPIAKDRSLRRRVGCILPEDERIHRLVASRIRTSHETKSDDFKRRQAIKPLAAYSS